MANDPLTQINRYEDILRKAEEHALAVSDYVDKLRLILLENHIRDPKDQGAKEVDEPQTQNPEPDELVVPQDILNNARSRFDSDFNNWLHEILTDPELSKNKAVQRFRDKKKEQVIQNKGGDLQVVEGYYNLKSYTSMSELHFVLAVSLTNLRILLGSLKFQTQKQSTPSFKGKEPSKPKQEQTTTLSPEEFARNVRNAQKTSVRQAKAIFANELARKNISLSPVDLAIIEQLAFSTSFTSFSNLSAGDLAKIISSRLGTLSQLFSKNPDLLKLLEAHIRSLASLEQSKRALLTGGQTAVSVTNLQEYELVTNTLNETVKKYGIEPVSLAFTSKGRPKTQVTTEDSLSERTEIEVQRQQRAWDLREIVIRQLFEEHKTQILEEGVVGDADAYIASLEDQTLSEILGLAPYTGNPFGAGEIQPENLIATPAHQHGSFADKKKSPAENFLSSVSGMSKTPLGLPLQTAAAGGAFGFLTSGSISSAIGTGAWSAFGGFQGALVGLNIGSAIGSFVPIIGTAIGGLAGTVIGGLGGALAYGGVSQISVNGLSIAKFTGNVILSGAGALAGGAGNAVATGASVLPGATPLVSGISGSLKAVSAGIQSLISGTGSFTSALASSGLVATPLAAVGLVTLTTITVITGSFLTNDALSLADESKYLEVQKTATPTRAATPQSVTYTLSIRPKLDEQGNPYTITINEATDTYRLTSKQKDLIPPNAPDLTSFSGPLPSEGKNTSYTVDFAAMTNYQDTRVTNTLKLSFSVGGQDEASSQTASKYATVTFGNPPTDLACLEFGPKDFVYDPSSVHTVTTTEWTEAEKEKIIEAFSVMTNYPKYLDLLCGATNEKITLYRSNVNVGYGGWASGTYKASKIVIYNEGIRHSVLSTRYTLIHELGHTIFHRQPQLYQSYLSQVDGKETYLPSYPLDKSSAEDFPETLSVYILNNSYSLINIDLASEYPKHYRFAKQEVFELDPPEGQ